MHGATPTVRHTDSCARPLRRRAANTARPARVRMRIRKPWVFARRRLFGWKVRFVTKNSPGHGPRRARTNEVTDSAALDGSTTARVPISVNDRGRWHREAHTSAVNKAPSRYAAALVRVKFRLLSSRLAGDVLSGALAESSEPPRSTTIGPRGALSASTAFTLWISTALGVEAGRSTHSCGQPCGQPSGAAALRAIKTSGRRSNRGR